MFQVIWASLESFLICSKIMRQKHSQFSFKLKFYYHIQCFSKKYSSSKSICQQISISFEILYIFSFIFIALMLMTSNIFRSKLFKQPFVLNYLYNNHWLQSLTHLMLPSGIYADITYLWWYLHILKTKGILKYIFSFRLWVLVTYIKPFDFLKDT